MKLTTDRLIDGSPCGRIDMVIKDLDLVLKINAMMRDFLDPSRWKELSKKTRSKILPGGDGSCRKTFKPIASLIAKGKLKEIEARPFPVYNIKRHHIVPIEELNGVSIALWLGLKEFPKVRIGVLSPMEVNKKIYKKGNEERDRLKKAN
ncbi:hypothetical protein Tco_0618570 [Tanacetum coccineum]